MERQSWCSHQSPVPIPLLFIILAATDTLLQVRRISLFLSPTRGFFLCSLLSYPVLISSLCLSSMNRGETTTYRGPTDHSRSRDTRMTALFPFQLSLSLSLSPWKNFEESRTREENSRTIRIFRDDRKNGEDSVVLEAHRYIYIA